MEIKKIINKYMIITMVFMVTWFMVLVIYIMKEGIQWA